MNIHDFKIEFLAILFAASVPFSASFAQSATPGGNISGLTQQSRINFVKASGNTVARNSESFEPDNMKKNYIALENERVANTANFVNDLTMDVAHTAEGLRQIIEEMSNKSRNDKYIAADYIVGIIESNSTKLQHISAEFSQLCSQLVLAENASASNILENAIEKYTGLVTVIDGYDTMLKELSIALRPYAAIDPKINKWYKSLQECVTICTKNVNNIKSIIKGTSLLFKKFASMPIWPKTEDELFKALVEENEGVITKMRDDLAFVSITVKNNVNDVVSQIRELGEAYSQNRRAYIEALKEINRGGKLQIESIDDFIHTR